MIQKKHSVLVIEDNEINREILYEILQDDYVVLCANDGKEGMKLLQTHHTKIDIVLLDIQMPVMNGYEVIEAVRHDPQLEQLPIVVMTGMDELDEEERCLKLGANDFVKKPYNPSVVKLRLESIIRLRESTAMLSEVEIDKQTGAYTYNAFMHYAQQWMSDGENSEYTLTMAEVMGFSNLHARVGNQAFEILKEAISETRRWLRGNLLVARFSFDRMLLFYPSPRSRRSETERRDYYEAKTVTLSKQLNLTIKAGVCDQIDASRPLADYIDQVRTALAEAKTQYNRYSTFVGPELQSQLQRKMIIERDMQKALAEGQMAVYFQPKHDAKSGRLVGAEALLRWSHPELGAISPAEFVPLFEQNGFILEADAYVWKQTCLYLQKWQQRGLPVVPVSVNASRQDLLRKNLMEKLMSYMTGISVSPSLLHVEVTERYFATLSKEAVEMVEELRRIGVCIELDDFGTGYSSLHSLAELPIDVVKFDMSFVRKLADPREQLLMRSCVDLVKQFNLKSLAEGVETEEILHLVADMGIDTVQGYHFSKPLPAEQFEAYCTKASTTRS